MNNSTSFISALLSFGSCIVFLISFLLVSFKSKFKAAEHRIILLFLFNFALYCAEVLVNLYRNLLSNFQSPYIQMVSWFGFGSFLFLFVFYAAYPIQITRKYRWMSLFLLLPLIEYFNNVVMFLYSARFISSDSSLFNIGISLTDFLDFYSFPYFLIALLVSISIIMYERLFDSFHLIRQIPIRWLTGMFSIIILLVVSNEVFYANRNLFYSLVLIFSIYFLFFIFQHPLVFSNQRVDFTNQLKKIFTDKVPTILLDKNNLIIHINQHALQILKHKKNQVLGKSVSIIIPSFGERNSSQKKNQTFELTTKSNLILSAQCDLEFISAGENTEELFQSIQFSEYAEVGRKVDEENQQIFQQLEILMTEEQPFLNNLLQQIDIAEKLSVTQRKLGEVLTSERDTTFPSYINGYRVEHAKKKLIDSANSSSIEEIGKQSGFNSKTSFYTIFKEHTGKTPGQFRNS